MVLYIGRKGEDFLYVAQGEVFTGCSAIYGVRSEAGLLLVFCIFS